MASPRHSKIPLTSVSARPLDTLFSSATRSNKSDFVMALHRGASGPRGACPRVDRLGCSLKFSSADICATCLFAFPSLANSVIRLSRDKETARVESNQTWQSSPLRIAQTPRMARTFTVGAVRESSRVVARFSGRDSGCLGPRVFGGQRRGSSQRKPLRIRLLEERGLWLLFA